MDTDDIDQVKQIKARYARLIEDGQKVTAFTTMPEWQWYVDNVLQPTIDEYKDQIMQGAIDSDKQDWIIRGIIQGLQLVIESTKGFIDQGEAAKKKAKSYQEYLDGAE